MTQPVEYEQAGYNSPGGLQIAKTAADLVGFYGKVPVVQRTFAASLHNTSAMVTSAGSLFQATHVAQIQEIQNTLIGLGIWATA
jgi:hypothetical protein